MTHERIIQEVIALLINEAKFRLRPKLFVADVDFEFDAILTGPDDQERLIAVLHVMLTKTSSVRNDIRALTSMLSRTESLRPLVLVAVSDDPNDALFEELAALCRVIVVPLKEIADADRDAQLRRFLRPLLPLKLPDPLKVRKPPEDRLRDKLKAINLASDPLVASLVKAASKSTKDVESVMIQAIEAIAKKACEVQGD